MKTRQGFVSNSSSSSFIIAVPTKVKTCKCCKRSDDWMLQAATKYLTTLTPKGNKMWTMTSAESVEEYFKTELDNLIKSKDYSENQLKVIEELEKNNQLFQDYEKLKAQLDRERSPLTLTQEAQYPLPLVRDRLKERKERIKTHLAEYDQKLKDIKDIIKKMKKFKSKDYNVYAFTIDNWATKAEDALKTMMADGFIEVIQRINT